MNLKEYIQSEIKSVLTEDYDLDQAFNDAQPVEEGVMSEINLLAKEAKDFKDFVKKFKKEYSDLTDAGDIKELEKWLKTIYRDAKNESVNELKLSSYGVKDLLKKIYDNQKLLPKLGFKNGVGIEP